MIKLLQDTVSMVRPQKCINPPTSTKENITQIKTSTEAVRSVKRRSVVTNIQLKDNEIMNKYVLRYVGIIFF